ncbi:MAG: SH3 domain-containing protein [Deltaproteobacteria bacterium]|nr:SH3 domain-containing protein [Deltaproteobacteria bacterium]MBW2638790.1 SH3 domain-containing protein [Deltaproteobacteria bacterium]MBW2680342.1 SH3 domain-containing protein [Deltaproteobacteria bacterium]
MKPCAVIIMILLLVFSSAAWAERLAVSVSVANVRSGPGENYDVLWEIEEYHPLDVIKKSGQWYQFRDFEGDEGWIHKSLVRNIPSIITKKERCNIRSGPTNGSAILFTVEKGIPFKVIKRKGSWIYGQHADGDKGWIHNSLVW